MNSFGTLDKLVINEIEYDFHNLRKLDTQFPKISKLPKSKKVLIENLLRLEDGLNINKDLESIPKITEPYSNMKINNDINYNKKENEDEISKLLEDTVGFNKCKKKKTNFYFNFLLNFSYP